MCGCVWSYCAGVIQLTRQVEKLETAEGIDIPELYSPKKHIN